MYDAILLNDIPYALHTNEWMLSDRINQLINLSQIYCHTNSIIFKLYLKECETTKLYMLHLRIISFVAIANMGQKIWEKWTSGRIKWELRDNLEYNYQQ